MKKLIAVLGPLVLSVPLFAQIVRQPPIGDPVDLPNARCHNVVIYQRGIPDNFMPPTDPVYPSAPLAALLAGGPHVAYDQPSCDVWFGDTFNLDSCVLCGDICSATLEITLRSCGSTLDCNDEITVGQAPFGKNGAGYVVTQTPVNSAGCGGGTHNNTGRMARAASASAATTPGPVVVKQVPLDVNKLRELVCKRKVTALDVFIQDDQIIDSMRLVITRP
jgi:hypothetical protein